MGDLVDFKKKSKQKVDSPETELDELFDDIIERNKEAKRKLAEKRTQDNKNVKRKYNIKPKDKK